MQMSDMTRKGIIELVLFSLAVIDAFQKFFLDLYRISSIRGRGN